MSNQLPRCPRCKAPLVIDDVLYDTQMRRFDLYNCSNEDCPILEIKIYPEFAKKAIVKSAAKAAFDTIDLM